MASLPRIMNSTSNGQKMFILTSANYMK